MKTILNEKQYKEYEKLIAWYDEQVTSIEEIFGEDKDGYAEEYYEQINTLYHNQLQIIMSMN